jgi:predicted O-methyltransferase YrrM
VLRAVFLDSWQQLYDRLVADDVTSVIQHGAVSLRNDVMWSGAEEEARAREVVQERGGVALFVASFVGMAEMCQALLNVGE